MKKKRNIILYIVLIVLVILVIYIGKNIYDNNNIDDNNNNNVQDTQKETAKNSNPTAKEQKNGLEKIKYYIEENRDRYLKYKNANPKLDDEKIVLYVNIGLDNEGYSDIKDSPNQYTNIILVNKHYQVSSSYVPKDLELIDNNYQIGNKKMTHDAAVAFNKMAKEAKEAGYNIRAISTYRSYDYQDGLYKRYVASDGVAKADTYSARPGHSEHQTGLAVDVDNIKMTYTNFGLTNEFEWMKNNSYKYGFILRYTSENEFITGYKNEPWHYRYVGVDIATKMKEENISSYEEYYFMYLN